MANNSSLAKKLKSAIAQFTSLMVQNSFTIEVLS